MRLFSAVVFLLGASCAEAEEFVARPRDREAGASAAGGHTAMTGETATSTSGVAGRGAGGTEGQTGAMGGAGGSTATGRGGSLATGGAPDGGLGSVGTGGMVGVSGMGGTGGGRGGGSAGGGRAGSSGAAGMGDAGGASICAAGCPLKVQYQNATSPPEPMTATVRVRVDVFNTGTKEVPLANLTVRYWFTDAGGSGDKATCYYAQEGCADITMKLSSVVPPRARADRYLDIGFSAVGNLAPGAHTGTISIGVQHVSGGPLYDQTDDYSYGANAPNAVDWPTVTAYVGGILSWGVEP